MKLGGGKKKKYKTNKTQLLARPSDFGNAQPRHPPHLACVEEKWTPKGNTHTELPLFLPQPLW